MQKNQLSVFIENRNGELCEITRLLAESNVNLTALNIAETKDYGVLRLIVDDEKKAAAVLSDHNYVVSVNQVQMLEVPNVPGGLNEILTKMTKANINVEYMYSIIGNVDGKAMMIFRVDPPEDFDKLY